MSFPKPELAGVFFAADTDGQQLPVIDVTHPAFAVTQSENDLGVLLDAYVREEARRAKHPRWLQRLMFRIFTRRSDLIRRLRNAQGGFLDGMSTYRLKLGPKGLDSSWATAIDERVAASLPCLCLRLRLQDVAEFLADDLAPRLAAAPAKALQLVNIAGGPSMDSLNALLILQKRNPHLLRDRSVHIHLFDLDQSGPDFARRSLERLSRTDGPLANVAVKFTHVPYRWTNVGELRDYLAQLPADRVTIASSEGGLFDYGSDEEIVANLQALREELPDETSVVGTLVPSKAPDKASPLRLRFAIRARDVADLERAVTPANWRVERSRQRPFHTCVLLKKSKQ